MIKHLAMGAILALSPLVVAAQGVPPPVVGDVVRQSGAAVTDSIRLNQDLIEREERDKAAAPAAPAPAAQPPQPLPPQPQPQTAPVPAPR